MIELTHVRYYSIKYLKLNYLFILVSSDRDELCLLEYVSPESRVGKLHDVVGTDQVETRLVLVHRVQDGLKTNKKTKKLQISFSLKIVLTSIN